eukprot:gene13432-8513_t
MSQMSRMSGSPDAPPRFHNVAAPRPRRPVPRSVRALLLKTEAEVRWRCYWRWWRRTRRARLHHPTEQGDEEGEAEEEGGILSARQGALGIPRRERPSEFPREIR